MYMDVYQMLNALLYVYVRGISLKHHHSQQFLDCHRLIGHTWT